ncbi:TIGR04076 family protein [candidate division KSB1 bacterium]|nr:TIGR04076 family protein [candidate division KSB1 bacterium]MBL7093268.1 TIGR04076 family protein [candidate division KSB1 bacterium]
MAVEKDIKDLQVKVIKITGTCPVYQKGDSFYLKKGYIIDPSKSSSICMHSLSSILPYHVALSHGVSPFSIGLNRKNENKGFVHCLDPCNYTGGGTVVFEVEVVE